MPDIAVVTTYTLTPDSKALGALIEALQKLHKAGVPANSLIDNLPTSLVIKITDTGRGAQLKTALTGIIDPLPVNA